MGVPDVNGMDVEVRRILLEQDRSERSDPRFDAEVRRHGIRVGRRCHDFGRRLGLPPEACKRLLVAGRFHDIGKTRVSPSVLFKEGRLTPEERAEVDRHVEEGGLILGSRAPIWLRDAVMLHHERWDGLGAYGLREGNIPLCARIVSIADVHDALMSPRSYKAGMSSAAALLVMARTSELDDASRCAFDPFLFRSFVSMEIERLPPCEARAALEEFAASHPGRPLSSRGLERAGEPEAVPPPRP